MAKQKEPVKKAETPALDYSDIYTDLLERWDEINFSRLMDHYKSDPVKKAEILIRCGQSIVDKQKEQTLRPFESAIERQAPAMIKQIAKAHWKDLKSNIKFMRDAFEKSDLIRYEDACTKGAGGFDLPHTLRNRQTSIEQDPGSLYLMAVGFADGQCKTILKAAAESGEYKTTNKVAADTFNKAAPIGRGAARKYPELGITVKELGLICSVMINQGGTEDTKKNQVKAITNSLGIGYTEKIYNDACSDFAELSRSKLTKMRNRIQLSNIPEDYKKCAIEQINKWGNLGELPIKLPNKLR